AKTEAPSNRVDLPPIVLCDRGCPEKLGRNGSRELCQCSWTSRTCSHAKRGHGGGQAGAVPPAVSTIFRRGSLCPVRPRAVLEQRDGAATPGVPQALRGLRCHRLFGPPRRPGR